MHPPFTVTFSAQCPYHTCCSYSCLTLYCRMRWAFVAFVSGRDFAMIRCSRLSCDGSCKSYCRAVTAIACVCADSFWQGLLCTCKRGFAKSLLFHATYHKDICSTEFMAGGRRASSIFAVVQICSRKTKSVECTSLCTP